MRAVVALGVLAFAGCAASPIPPDRMTEVAQAERGFAAKARTDGVKAAFLSVLSDDATLFRPGPVDGNAFVAARPEMPFRLEWEPRRVAAAASGDIGYSSGPYRLTLNDKPDEPVHGQFFTVWRHRDGEGWKVLIDQGIGHPQPVVLDRPFEPLQGDGSRATRSIAAAEADFARASSCEGLVAAYRAHGSSRIRLLRDDLEPLDGMMSLDRLPQPGARWSWVVTDSGTGKSEDLAWTMGRYRSAPSVLPPSGGYFVRFWRAERGDWKILADVLAPTEETAR